VTGTDGLREPYSDDLWMGWLTDALCAEGATPTAAERYATALLPLIRAAYGEGRDDEAAGDPLRY
jgi:hypothetical protein